MGEISQRSARSVGKYRESKEKVSFGAEKSDVPSKNRQKLDSKWENGKGNRRQNEKKRAHFLEKTPELGPKTGKSAKNGDFGAKKVGWGRGEKMGFTADFAML